MSSLVQNLCKLSHSFLANLKHPSVESLDEARSKLVALLGQLTLRDLYLSPKELGAGSEARATPFSYEAPVSYVNVYESNVFSLTVFGLRRKSSRIPLHDHPGMHGFVKCIHGAVSIKSYTILQDAQCKIPTDIRNKVRTSALSQIVPAICLGEETLSSESTQVCSLTPSERNLHEIKPASADMAVIVDIIAPPYTSVTRSFFYIIIDTIFDTTLNKSITWLYKTADSSEFYCDDVPYTGPCIKVT